MKKVLLADRLPEECAAILEEAGLAVESRPGLDEGELTQAVADVHGLICRSGATITPAVLDGAPLLEAICRAGVGVDNIDVPAASRRGVVVMNTPGGNAVSTAEHAFALMLALARNVAPANISMREGRWERKSFVGSQLAGCVLGVVGLGRIGQEVAKRAVSFGMTVRVHDPFVGADSAARIGVELVESLDELLAGIDYLTVHVPGGPQTKGMIGAAQISLMKPGARVINCARGAVVDQDAVVAAVEEGRLGGAAFDVYVTEPPTDLGFAAKDRILATPHLGASTDAAQLAVALEAAQQIRDALLRRSFRNAVNISAVPPEEMKILQPYCDLAARLGKLVARLNTGRPEELAVSCHGEVAEDVIEPIVNYGAMGMMQDSLGGNVNVVSAPVLAQDRGIRITSSGTVGASAGFTDLVEVTLTTDAGPVTAAGTLFGRNHPRIVQIAGFYVEIMSEGHVLIVFGADVPGLIGSVGATLGAAGVNIARMGFGRQEAGGSAILALNLDTPCDEAVMARLVELDVVDRAVAVEL